jgi:Ca2+-binding RTX toxin-like protein
MATITGTNQADVLIGEDDEPDLISGENGDDELRGLGRADDLFGGNGEDRLLGNAGGDDLFGENGDDALKGGGDDDDLFGGNGGDTLRGGGDQDELHGENGTDILRGGTGDDTLDGGSGDDTLRGGGGDDLFVFTEPSENDTVIGFQAGAASVDVLDLTAFGFADFNAVLAASSDNINGDVVISFQGGSVTLIDVSEAQLHADDVLI